MINRFIKYNKTLVGIFAITLVAIIALAVVLVIEYLKMSDATQKVEKMKSDVASLLDKRRNQVIAVDENLERLKIDKKFYKLQENKLQRLFISPYTRALNAMAHELKREIVITDDEGNSTKKFVNYKNGNELANDFITFLTASNEDKSIRVERFRSRDEDGWNAGLGAFAKEANGEGKNKAKISFEKVTPDNVLEYFFMAVGLPRDVLGGTLDYNADIISKYEKALFKYVINNNIRLSENASSFDLNSNASITGGVTDLSNTTVNAEITSDLITRICQSKPKISAIDDVKFLKISDWQNVTDGKINQYKITIIGSMDSIRGVLKTINDSIDSNRIYVLRNSKISIASELDEAAKILQIERTPSSNKIVTKEKEREKSAEELEIEQMILKNDMKKPYHERRNYGEVKVGAVKEFMAELYIDYYYIRKSINLNNN